MREYTREEIDTIPDFDLSLVEVAMTQQAVNWLDELTKEPIIISDWIEPIELYDDQLINRLLKNMLLGFEHKAFREHMVAFKFNPNSEIRYLPYRLFLVNLMFWRPLITFDPGKFERDNCDSMIVTLEQSKTISSGFIKKYVDNFYLKVYNKSSDNHTRNAIMCEFIVDLGKISKTFNPYIGIGINVEIFRELCKKYPEFEEIMNTKIEEGMQPNNIEDYIKEQTAKAFKIIMDDPQFNILKPIVTTAKSKQLSEIFINIGCKPNIEGKTMPTPINSNYLKEGLNNISDKYKIGLTSKKAAIINNEFMGKSGHMAMMTAIACSQARLSRTTDRCNTVNFVSLEITSKKDLDRLRGRRYKFHGQKDFMTIDPDRDSHLVGQTILLRSPITCACTDGVCKECYGDLAYTNNNLNSIGNLAATIFMNPIVQGVLSVKHTQETITELIKFDESFDDIFSIFGSDIMLSPDDSIDISKYMLVIKDCELEAIDGSLEIGTDGHRTYTGLGSEDSEEEEESFGRYLPIFVEKFEVWKIQPTSNKKKPKILSKAVYQDFGSADGKPKQLYVQLDLLMNKMIKSENVDPDDGCQYRYIKLDSPDISPEDYLFIVELENKEKTAPLKDIQRLIDSKDHEGCVDYIQMTNKLLSLMNQAGLSQQLVHGEMILRELIVRSDNILKRPNFSALVTPRDYNIGTINTLLVRHPSITTSMSTHHLKQQLVELHLTFSKTECSGFDYMYMKQLANPYGEVE